MLDILFEHLQIISDYNLPIRSEDTLEMAVSILIRKVKEQANDITGKYYGDALNKRDINFHCNCSKRKLLVDKGDLCS